jgi:hypothetical protein
MFCIDTVDDLVHDFSPKRVNPPEKAAHAQFTMYDHNARW